MVVYLTPTEDDRLTIFLTASLAREGLGRGLRLSLPEAVAVIADAVHWAARSGATFEEARQAGVASLRPDQLLDGVAALLDEVRVEPLFEEGTRMVVVRWPLGRPEAGPGETHPADTLLPPVDGPRRHLVVVNLSSRIVRLSSHYPLHLVNRKLSFDREAARGWRLDLPAGQFLRWAPGEARTVRLVRCGGISEGS
jgi:urease subunit gamma/beta